MSLPHLILGLLNEEPLSGYDLNKRFQSTIHPFWQTEQNQIYRTLRRMHEQGLVEIEVIVQDGSPNKKRYHLTDAGQAELKQWLLQPVETEVLRQAWLGQFYFAGMLNYDELLALFEAYLANAKSYLESLEATMAQLPADFDSPELDTQARLKLLPLHYGITSTRNDIGWLETVIKQFQSRAD